MQKYQLEVITEKDVLLSSLAPEVIEIEAGFTVEKRVLPIVEGVEFVIFGEDEALLKIGDTEFEFELNAETSELIATFDVYEPLEMLCALYRNRIGRTSN